MNLRMMNLKETYNLALKCDIVFVFYRETVNKSSFPRAKVCSVTAANKLKKTKPSVEAQNPSLGYLETVSRAG